MLRDNLFLASLALLIVLVLVVLGFVLYVAVRGGAAKPGTDPKLVKLRFDSLRTSFRQAVELIEANIAARSERYGIPWVLVLNEGGANRQLPIAQSGVASALSVEAASSASTQGIAWHFFDKGVVVEMQGAYLGSPDDENAAEKPWDEFLGLCQKYRPQRPFDSVVITVPAELLLDSSPDAQLELTKLARMAHRRLWLAQNRFAMRFAVYLAVSGCERMEGFSAFARALPEPMRAGMLGWSSPYDLSTTYQESWVGEAVDSVVRTISDVTAELFVVNPSGADASAFLLPNRMELLRSQLQVYTDELMRPSAYHEPFFFRGMYLTGDSSLAAQTANGPEAALDASAAESGADANELVSQLMQEPAFLRDLFEKKVFMEYGLARPSRQQLARPALTRVARWGGVLVLGAWGVGLVVATVQLHDRNADIAKTLQQVEADAHYRARAHSRGEVIPPEWYRSRTLVLLTAIERLGAEKGLTFLMPGSWKAWDNLDARVAERIEREFGEIAIATLRRELYARASELTGVAQDDSTSELIIGAECVAPKAEASQKAGLAVEDTPEFAAILDYLSAVERLDKALAAMQRLQKTETADVDDLRLLVQYALGAELPGNVSQSIRLFKSSGASAGVNVMHIQQAVRCSLVKGMGALDQRIFANNDLLLTERQFEALGTRLFLADTRTSSYTQTVAGYKEILGVIHEQENLLATGRGAWMHQSDLALGPAYDAALARIGESERLLGAEAVELVNQRAANGFQKFNAEFATRFNPEASTGIAWQEKEARFALSAERLALRDAIVSLLAQPFMSPTSDRDLPEIPAQGMLSWDGVKLDQALALGEVHKRFVSEGLVKFPVPAHASVMAFVNFQFARLVNDKVVESLSSNGRVDPASAADASAFDASRGRLAKVQALLTEWGATENADSLQRLVSQDAMVRLRQLDHSLNQFDLYAIRGRDFSHWSGDHGPMLQAFGVPDTPAMQQYLALQFSRAETLGRQSEIYLASLDKSASEGQTAQRWRAINRELERYRLKNPNSSLSVYEQFLSTAGTEMDRTTCAEKLSGKSPGARPADYFAERHLQVYNALLQRCTELRYTELYDFWDGFSASFNRLLAGRQPFAMAISKDAPDADFEDVGQLFRTSEKLLRALKEPTTGSRLALHSAPVRNFADQYERVRTFMAPLYPVDESAVAGYDVAVEFRANQAAELEGNKVIDWVLEMGSQTLRLRDPARPLRWEPGTPITLTLRLAKDVPGNALADPMQPAMTVDGKTVTYRYTDTWSLLRMIQRQRESDGAGRADGRTQLLRMEFPIGTGIEVGKGAQPDSRAKVYLRLTVSAVGKRTPLTWPVHFPSRAPDFGRP